MDDPWAGYGPPPAWEGHEDVVLCVMVNEFGGVAWDLASESLSAAGSHPRPAAACKERFRRLIAVHSAALGGAAGAGGQLRVTPELTRGLLRIVAADAFNVGGGDAGGFGGVAGGGVGGGSAGGVPPETPPAVSKLRGAVQGVRSRSTGAGAALTSELRGELTAGVRELFSTNQR